MMKNATKAALISGLVFPGTGLLLFKEYARAAVFIIPALLALWFLCTGIYDSVYPLYTAMLQDAEAGILKLDLSDMGGLYTQLHGEIEKNLSAHQSQLHTAEIIFIAAWLCSIVSSYFVGKKRDLEGHSTHIRP